MRAGAELVLFPGQSDTYPFLASPVLLLLGGNGVESTENGGTEKRCLRVGGWRVGSDRHQASIVVVWLGLLHCAWQLHTYRSEHSYCTSA